MHKINCITASFQGVSHHHDNPVFICKMMIYIVARVRAALVWIMRSDGSLPRGAYKQNWAQQGRAWAPRTATKARTRVRNRPQAFSATIWKLSQTKPQHADVISYLSPGKKKEKARKIPSLFLQIMLINDIRLLQALCKQLSLAACPEAFPFSNSKVRMEVLEAKGLRCPQLSSKGCTDMGLPSARLHSTAPGGYLPGRENPGLFQ